MRDEQRPYAGNASLGDEQSLYCLSITATENVFAGIKNLLIKIAARTVKKQQHRRKNSAQLIPRGSSIGRSGKFNRELLRCSQQNRRQPAIPVARRASAREADGASAHDAVRVHGGGARYCDTVSGCGEAQPS
jgi:hypothetical protein